MGFLNLRDSRTKARKRINNVDLSGTVQELKEKTAEITKIAVQEQQMVYCGKTLDDQKTLIAQGLTDGVTIYLFHKKGRKAEAPSNEFDSVKPMKLTELLQKAMNNPLYQASVKRVLQDADAIEQLIVATPELKKDPVALSLLRDPELLLQVAETANIEKIIKKHPALAQAASHVIAAVTEDTSSRQSSQMGNNDSAELADLERVDPGLVARAEMIATQEEGIQERHGAQPQQQISPAQLAMALSQAGVTTSGRHENSQARQSAGPQVSTQPGPSMISQDFFSQAIASALAATPFASNSSQAVSQATYQQSHQAALQQMRAMGITNDTVSLRALQQTGGDVEAAIALIFADEMN